MIRKIVIVLSSLLFIGASSYVLAKGKPTQAELWHCGCVEYDEPFATVYLEWSFLIVSPKSRGHRKHQDGDTEICTYFPDGFIEEVEVPWERDWDDCENDDNDGGDLAGVEVCTSTTPEEGALCGHPIVD